MCQYAQAQDVIGNIKEIDSQMKQGTIVYTTSEKSGRKSRDCELYYSKDGKYNHKISYSDGLSMDFYFDGSNYFIYNKANNQVEYKPNDSLLPDKLSIFFKISPMPNAIYGRGLSELSDVTYNNSTNEITGYLDNNTKIVAKLEPKYQYAASSIKRYMKDRLIMEIKNTNPILVDNKYYIFSESDGLIYKTKIKSATFREPTKDSYTFDMKKNNHVVIDTREGNPVHYQTMPDNTDPESLRKLSKKKLEEQAKMQQDAKKQLNNGNNKNLMLMLLAIFITALILIVAVKKYKEFNNEKKD